MLTLIPWASTAFTWIKSHPLVQWLGGIALAFFGYHVWKRNVEAGVRRQEREAEERRSLERQVETAKAETRVAETARATEAKYDDRKDQALAAGAGVPEYRDADELREQDPGLAGILGIGGGGDGSSERR